MLQENDWLPQAKRLSIGMRMRVRHGREGRANMTVCNDTDRYWAYCQRCKDGGVVLKDHVRLGATAPAESCDLTLPYDRVPVIGSEWERPVGEFLARKNMDFLYLPPSLEFSCTRKRILVQTSQGYMGRDITENSHQKWLTYNRQHYLQTTPSNQAQGTAVVVEDTFSWYKGQFAMPQYDWFCALGTSLHDSLVLKLVQFDRVLIFFDGDTAGYTGAEKAWRRLRSLGVQCHSLSPPFGKDPKDMQLHEIVRLLGERDARDVPS